jgi:Tol biopolymer transport system component
MSSSTVLRRPAVFLALGLCAIGGVVTLLGRLANGPQVAQKRVPLSAESGANTYAAFSPDGRRVAYSARGTSAEEGYHILVRPASGGTPRQLTSGTANDVGPVWSPNGGELAFLHVEGGRAQVIVMPAEGGAERIVTEFAAPADEAQPRPSVSWTSDGKSLAVVQSAAKQLPSIALVSRDTAQPRKLTNPPEGTEGDSTPVVSPDGGTLAFVRNTGTDSADVYLCDLAGGAPRRLTFDDRAIRGIAWTRDGRDIIYSANRAGGWRLWRLPAYGGSPHELSIAGKQAQFPTVAPKGNRLAYTESPSVSAIWRADLGEGESASEHPLIRSLGRETAPAWSPDGKKIADISDQSGADEIWVGDANGGNRVQVTSLPGGRPGRVRWSPDSKRILYDVSTEHGSEIYSSPAVAHAAPARVALSGSNSSWSHDGKRIYFQSRGHVWKVNADGGDPQQLSDEMGASQPVESSDGKFVYFRQRRTIWRVPVAGGAAEETIIPDHDLLWTTLQPSKTGLYYMEWERGSRRMVVSFYDFAARKSVVVFPLKNADMQSASFSVSPDGKSILYPRVDQSQTNLMLVENFR